MFYVDESQEKLSVGKPREQSPNPPPKNEEIIIMKLNRQWIRAEGVTFTLLCVSDKGRTRITQNYQYTR
jgi:hypothetical protein